MIPQKISIADKKYLHILWEDGEESNILLSELRKNCPCANCVTDRQKRPSNYIPLLSEVQLTLKDIKIVGSYAIQLTWQDGHDEGIYSYEFLRELDSK
jgi:DUF971 family protein